MPNWCVNKVKMENLSTDMTHKLLCLIDSCGCPELFQYLRPIAKDNRDDRIASWGTNQEPSDLQIHKAGGAFIEMSFETPRLPPIALYEYLEETYGMSITAGYSEYGMEFLGHYQEGYHERYTFADIVDLDCDELAGEVDDDSGIEHDYTEEQELLKYYMCKDARNDLILKEVEIDMGDLGLGG